MNHQHFMVTDGVLKDSAMAFLALRKKCEGLAGKEHLKQFRRAGLSMSQAYINLSQQMGVGSGLFSADKGSKTIAMLVERFNGEIVLRAPLDVKIKPLFGLKAITPNHYIDLRSNARASVAAAFVASASVSTDLAKSMDRQGDFKAPKP